MHIVWTILLGLAAGVIAKLIFPGKENMGWIMTTLLGIAGSFLSTYPGQFLKIYEPGETAGFIGAIIGALIILFIISLFRRKAR
ncbi:MAG TPA: GlsB/YeaQ/YmgE family stress response membrane protein [Candidatus Saccharicenans sp.]|nr:GlsB/YeaQ/YmgE family stress response membrane protein [Candidatus Saccharicenans sp.]HPC88027.1 GlsB/YeaQ/YmgE family stress response membrane protein [Candidatus Saccharicenans sp.]HQE64763.1 GlsB/YeaQ/YmgE family stress response membrane protein [Candidatus Saccharicenans sp.]HQH60405.1 GlsB/YeaQ/YmgE family stress response membrane protein [Candidatus Saccharicenans sp.]HQI22687.1 GlsB/YeaQ/YmgE family stress response membrane protein [Candidatus Saccharicenans sp.]